MNEWGVPDWRDSSAYPSPNLAERLPLNTWRWQFLRRTHEYRQWWQDNARGAYLAHLAVLEARQRDGWRTEDAPAFDDAFMFPATLEGRERFSIRTGISPAIGGSVTHPTLCATPFGPPFDPFLPRPGEPGFPEPYEPGSLKIISCRHVPWFMELREGEEDLDPDEDYDLVTVTFDRREPITAQLARAKEAILQARLNQVEEGLTPVVSDEVRHHRLKWPRYLRAIDGRDAGASYAEIAEVLDGPGTSYRRVEDILKTQVPALRF